MVTVIEAGCAECGVAEPGDPLVEKREFPTIEAAKAHYAGQLWLNLGPNANRWEPHPQGGEHVVAGQGSVWILPDPDAGLTPKQILQRAETKAGLW